MYGSSLIRERVPEHEQRGGGLFLPRTGDFYLGAFEGLAFASLRLFAIDPSTLETRARSDSLYDVVRDLDQHPDEGPLVGCTWKRVFAFEPGTLRIKARVEHLGEGNACLAFDRAGDHVVVGSNLRKSVKVIDSERWLLSSTKRVGQATQVVRGSNPHELVLLHGPTGRVVWFDCGEQRTIHELRTPPFGDAIATESSILLATGDPRPMAFVPADDAGIIPTTGGDSPVPGYLPMAGSEMVTVATGVASVDPRARNMRGQTPIPRLNPTPYRMLQAGPSGDSVFLLSEGWVRSFEPRLLKIDWEWRLPDGSFPLAVLANGERALVSFGRYAWTRMALVERRGQP